MILQEHLRSCVGQEYKPQDLLFGRDYNFLFGFFWCNWFEKKKEESGDLNLLR